MLRTVHLVIAAAVLVGGISLATAQTASNDGTPDNTLSYGPKAQQRAAPTGPAARTANPAQQPVSGGQYYRYDQSPDNTMSYGPRQAR
jgi:hypothetical protein